MANKKENGYQPTVIKRLQEMFPTAVIRKEDPTFNRGFPDLLILFEDGRYANLECKRSEKEEHRPGQDQWVERLNKASFARFIYPENQEEVFNELERTFKN